MNEWQVYELLKTAGTQPSIKVIKNLDNTSKSELLQGIKEFLLTTASTGQALEYTKNLYIREKKVNEI